MTQSEIPPLMESPMLGHDIPKYVSPARHREQACTADAEEISRFTAMAEEWWDPWGKFKPLHKFNPVRIEFMKKKMAAWFDRDADSLTPFTGLTLLDVGCGGGLLSEPLAALGFSVTGIDAGEKNINIAQAHAKLSGSAIDYRIGGPEDMTPKSFDVVLTMEVIEHVPDPRRFIALTAQALKPGGLFFGATLNRTTKSYALAVLGAEYLLRWLPAGTHDWNKFVKPSEFAAHLRAADIDICELQGMEYTPFRDEWRPTRNLDVNYLVFGAKS